MHIWSALEDVAQSLFAHALFSIFEYNKPLREHNAEGLAAAGADNRGSLVPLAF